MKRPVIKGDVCNINFNDDIFDVIFSHHVLGLCPDYKKAYQEMLRVCKKDGYIITLADIPGNLKKHYSMVNDIQEVKEMLKDCPKHDIMYEGY
jgi:ubiquinone/menaquinone biosynthesis C-methylase UbiE